MSTLKQVEYAGKMYPVRFVQTPNWSFTGMSKKGLVWHATTSNSFEGALSWLTNPSSGVSALALIGREVGEIAILGLVNQKLWHAGKVFEPHARFKAIAEKGDMNGSGSYVNPNLYLDGVEFAGGVDTDKSGKVEHDEIELTEWQYHVATQVANWHAIECGYELTEETQVIHQDIASYKPDLTYVLDEIKFRLFKKSKEDVKDCKQLQEKIETQDTIISLLLKIISLIFKK